MKITKISKINEKRDTESMIHALDNDVEKLYQLITGRISFGTGNDGDRGENIQGEFQSWVTNETPDTEEAVLHTLGVTPIGWVPISIDKGGVLYKGPTAWDETTVYFKCSAASATVVIFLLKGTLNSAGTIGSADGGGGD